MCQGLYLMHEQLLSVRINIGKCLMLRFARDLYLEKFAEQCHRYPHDKEWLLFEMLFYNIWCFHRKLFTQSTKNHT